jgi:hypothetical protein
VGRKEEEKVEFKARLDKKKAREAYLAQFEKMNPEIEVLWPAEAKGKEGQKKRRVLFTDHKWDISEFTWPGYAVDTEKERYDYLQYIDTRDEKEVELVYKAVLNFCGESTDVPLTEDQLAKAQLTEGPELRRQKDQEKLCKNSCRPIDVCSRTIDAFNTFGMDGFYKDDMKIIRIWSQSILELNKIIHNKDQQEFLEKKKADYDENEKLEVFKKLVILCQKIIKKFSIAKPVAAGGAKMINASGISS